MILESQIIDYMCQTSLGVCVNSIKSRINEDKLRKKIQEFAEIEFQGKFNDLDILSEIDFVGLSSYLKNSLRDEIENYITSPNKNIRKTLITKACHEAKVDKSLKIFANNLKDDLFNDIKSEILENTNKVMEGIGTFDAKADYIIGTQAVGINQLNKLSNDVNIIKTAVMQPQIERNTATNASIFNPLDLLRDFGVSIGAECSINTAIKYSSKSEIMSIRFCVKREGRTAKFNTADDYLADLNYTMIEDTVDVISSTIIQNGKKTERNYDDNYMGAVCCLPWLSFSEMEFYSSGLDRFTDSQCISSKLIIVPKRIQVTYNIENGDRETLWHGVRYKLHRSIENNNRCCYYENETSNSKIKINIKFTSETILQDGESIVINPQPDIALSIVPLDNSNARTQLEYYQSLIKLYSTDTLKFVNDKTMKTDFSCSVKVNDLSEDKIKSIIGLYKKIIDIEEYFKIEFKLEFPLDVDLWDYINMIHGLIKNQKITVNHSSISLTTHLEPCKMDIGSSYGW